MDRAALEIQSELAEAQRFQQYVERISSVGLKQGSGRGSGEEKMRSESFGSSSGSSGGERDSEEVNDVYL